MKNDYRVRQAAETLTSIGPYLAEEWADLIDMILTHKPYVEEVRQALQDIRKVAGETDTIKTNKKAGTQ